MIRLRQAICSANEALIQREFVPHEFKFLEAKINILTVYCVNVIFSILQHSNSNASQAHETFKNVVKLRLILTKLRAIQGKLESHIESLIKNTSQASHMQKLQGSKLNAGLLLKPNIQFSEGTQKASADAYGKKFDQDTKPFQK
jgi:hypothetical protein